MCPIPMSDYVDESFYSCDEDEVEFETSSSSDEEDSSGEAGYWQCAWGIDDDGDLYVCTDDRFPPGGN